MSGKRQLAYAPHGYKRWQPVAILTYPDCRIEIVRKGQETQTIGGSSAGNTVHGRISAFVDIARKEGGAVLILCDDDDAQQEVLMKMVRQAMPEMRQVAIATILGKNAA